MKKMVFCIIPLIMILMGCASSGTAVAETGGNSPGMDLDAAIREAAAQMEAKIPSKTMVALVSVASPSTAFSTQVLTRLESAIVSSGKLVVVDRANLDKVREEQGFQLSGEVDDESAKSIGKLLGAGAIVTGSLADLGDVYSLTLKAINIETATVAVSYLADLAKSTRVETLLASGSGPSGTQTTQRRNVGGSTPTVAQAPVTPVNPPAPTGVIKDAYAIGDTGPAGGIVFFDMGFNMDGWQYLEAAPQDIPGKFQWGAYGQRIGTQTSLGSGEQNTEIIILALGSTGETVKAAQVAGAATYGGYDDWFLPSKDELDLMYKNLKQARHLGNFQNTLYWSSSEGSANYALASRERNNGGFAWYQSFSDGAQSLGSNSDDGKKESYSVRVIRRF
jgi:hypothetical protein